MGKHSAAMHRIAASTLRGFAPPPDLKPSVWAEQNVHIPVGNAIPGLIRFDNAPYQRQPLDMVVDPSCEKITLKWGAQVGKTMVALCAQGYFIEQDPRSQIMMQPSQGDLATWLQTKFNPLVEANEGLSSVLAKPRGRHGVNNDRMKSYSGCFIMFAWSGSPRTMRGRSAPFIVCDETDGYDRTSEGHPVSLLWQRAATFGDQRKLLQISTPTVKGLSWIDDAYEDGDQRQFHVACRHCAEPQVLQWSNVTWEKDEDGKHRPGTAGYICKSCGVVWTDAERVASIRKAEMEGHGWKAQKPFEGHASYHLNELYSTMRRQRDVVQSFLDKKHAGDLQTFVNVSLAEVWEEESEKIEFEELLSRSEQYEAQVPLGAAVLTAGVDMQEDRLEVEVVGWGLGEESWSIDYHVIWGDPLQREIWEELDEYLSQTFQHESGAILPIAATCVDTGGGRGSENRGYTQAAYEWLAGKQRRRIFAIKGMPGWGRPIVSAPTKTKTGRRGRPVSLFTVGTYDAKLIIIRRLQIAEHGPGFSHFPNTRDPEYFQQLTSERMVTKKVRGYVNREWVKTRERNESFDCRVYAYAALKMNKPNLARALDRIQPPEDWTPELPYDQPPDPFGEPPEEVAKPKRKTRRRKSRRTTRGRRGSFSDGL